MPSNSSEYQRGYRAGQKSKASEFLRKKSGLDERRILLKILSELAFLRKIIEQIEQNFVRPPCTPPYMNLPSEDEESRTLQLASKNLRILQPDSSLPASPRANGHRFYPDLDQAAAAFKKGEDKQ